MKLRSHSIADGSPIAERYALGRRDDETHIALSDNVNPHLAWDEVPDGTRSFAVTCVDSEAPSRADDVNKVGRQVSFDLPRVEFVHWLLVDLPSDVREIAEGEFSRGVVRGGKRPEGPRGLRQGLNDYTGWFAGDADMKGSYHGYDGPCPPWNDERVHVYTFTVHALDVPRLQLTPSFTIAQLREAMGGHVIAQASFSATYAIFEGARAPHQRA